MRSEQHLTQAVDIQSGTNVEMVETQDLKLDIRPEGLLRVDADLHLPQQRVQRVLQNISLHLLN